MKIQHSINYGQFEIIKSNRPIDWRKVARMREGIKEKNLSKAYLIVVNSKSKSNERYHTNGSTYGIVDGQHRFVSLKLEKRKIYFIVNDDVSLMDIPKAAALQSTWRMTDYIHHYCAIGYKNYQLFQSYMDNNKFPPSATMLILCGDRGHTALNSLKNGELKFKRNWSSAADFSDAIDEIGEYIKFNKQARFLEAYVSVFDNDKYDHDKMIGKMKYLWSKIRKCTDKHDHLRQLQYLYNYKSREKVRFVK